jgi:hypothetical protein
MDHSQLSSQEEQTPPEQLAQVSNNNTADTTADANNVNTDTLLAQLAQATAPPPPVMDSMPGSISNTPPDFRADFAPDMPDLEQEPEKNEAPGTLGEAAAAATLPPKELAKTIIDMVDTLLQMGAPNLYLSSVKKEEAAAIRAIASKLEYSITNKQDVTYTVEEQEQMGLVKEFNDYLQSLPLTKEEKQNLLTPLTLVLQKNSNYQLTPEMSLLATGAMVAFPRPLPIILNYMKNR